MGRGALSSRATCGTSRAARTYPSSAPAGSARVAARRLASRRNMSGAQCPPGGPGTRAEIPSQSHTGTVRAHMPGQMPGRCPLSASSWALGHSPRAPASHVPQNPLDFASSTYCAFAFPVRYASVSDGPENWEGLPARSSPPLPQRNTLPSNHHLHHQHCPHRQPRPHHGAPA